MIKKTSIFVFLLLLFFGVPHPCSADSPLSGKFIILNLHWNSQNIRLNTLHVVQGTLKNNRRLPKGEPFIYRVLSASREVIEEGYLAVPQRIHFDYMDSENNQLQGGILSRTETDFVVKIPVRENYQRILFYKLKGAGGKNIQTLTGSAEKQLGDMVGEIELQ